MSEANMAFGYFNLSSISWCLGDRTKTYLFSRYMPSYSTRLKYESETWSVLPPSSADPMGAVDPIWTESNWNTISLRVYSVQGASYDHFILVAGVAVTALSYLLIVIVKALITKALKQD